MSTQLTFDLPSVPALGRDAFFVSPSNQVAVALIETSDWAGRKMVLSGPAKSGKTHLAHVWAERTAAMVINTLDLANHPTDTLAQHPFLVIEDVHLAAGNAPLETLMFHVHNLALAEGATLLFTGTGAPSDWPFTLPDLASRLQGTSLAQLLPPDDQLLAMVLAKQFSDRQLAPPPAVMRYLITHMERSFQQASEIVQEMDQIALRERKGLTRAVAVAALDKLGQKQA